MIINKKTFILFSLIFFLLISLIAIAAFTISARQINYSFIEQQLSIASETIRLRLASIVNSELALVRKLADTPVIRQFFENPSDSEMETLAHNELNEYQEHFDLKVVFWINDVDKIFYSTGNAPYVVDPDDPVSYWYNLTLYNTERYNFNINYNPNMQQINLWINVPVFLESGSSVYSGRKTSLGMLGTGIDLTEFSDFIVNAYKDFDENIITYTFNKFDEITSAANYELVYNKVRLDKHLGETGKEILEIAHNLENREGHYFIYDDKFFLVSSIPEMEWFLAVSYPLPGLLAISRSMNSVFFSMLFLVLFILIVINIYIAYSETALEKQNVQLIEANKKSEVASRAKSDFLAAMSHELRTPLNTIIGFSEIELNKSIKNETMDNVTRIYQSGIHLLKIINDILDLSKLDSGKFEITSDEYDTAYMISSTVDMNIIRIGSKCIQFSLEISSDFPAKLTGDELRIKQIINNLLSNAIKYTREGMVQLIIDCKEMRGNHVLVTFTVKDSGIGIRSEDIGKLFDDYTQLDTRTNREVEGTGLGLSISKKIARMMGGDITVESEYGKGSCFTAHIIQERNDSSFIGADTSYALRRCQHIPLASRALSEKKERYGVFSSHFKEENIKYFYKILAVDDHLNNLLLIREQLKPYGIQVDTASSGHEAIEKIQNMDELNLFYDLILMDHMMPGMDGIETMKAIKNNDRYANIPIIVLTANALRGMKEYYLEQGFADFIAKPVDQNTLNEVLKKHLTENKEQIDDNSGQAIVSNDLNSVFSSEIIKQRIDKLNHICAAFEIVKEADDDYKKCCDMLRACCEELESWAQNHTQAAPAAAETAQRLQKAIMDGDTEMTGKTLKELGTAALSSSERELYFSIYDALMDDNNEKALERIKEWLE